MNDANTDTADQNPKPKFLKDIVILGRVFCRVEISWNELWYAETGDGSTFWHLVNISIIDRCDPPDSLPRLQYKGLNIIFLNLSIALTDLKTMRLDNAPDI